MLDSFSLGKIPGVALQTKAIELFLLLPFYLDDIGHTTSTHTGSAYHKDSVPVQYSYFNLWP